MIHSIVMHCIFIKYKQKVMKTLNNFKPKQIEQKHKTFDFTDTLYYFTLTIG